jgi:hypothetical protein
MHTCLPYTEMTLDARTTDPIDVVERIRVYAGVRLDFESTIRILSVIRSISFRLTTLWTDITHTD